MLWGKKRQDRQRHFQRLVQERTGLDTHTHTPKKKKKKKKQNKKNKKNKKRKKKK